MSSKNRYSSADRVDGIPRPWEFTVGPEVEDYDELWKIGDNLFKIPVQPLPDPLVNGNDDWRESMTIGGYAFAKTWAAYQDVLRDAGTLITTVFTKIPLEDERETPPRDKYAAITVIKLPKTREYPQLFLWTNIHANGRVYNAVLDEHVHKNSLDDLQG